MSLSKLLSNVNPLDVTAMAVAFGKMDTESKRLLMDFVKLAASKRDTSAFVKASVEMVMEHEEALERGEPIRVKATVVADRGNRLGGRR